MKRNQITHKVSFAAIFLGMVSLAPAQTTVQPATRQAGERMWKVTDYVKGTPDQIHEILTHEVHRLASEIKITTDAIAADKTALDADRKSIITAQLDRPEYRQAQASAAAGKVKLDAAHAAHDSAAAMDAGSAFNKARGVVAAFERDADKAADNSDAVKADKSKLADDQQRVDGLNKGLKEAQKWHDDQVDAIHNSANLPWPFKPHDIGTLGEIVPTEFKDNGDLICTYVAAEKISVDETTEGFNKIRVREHTVRVTLKGSNLKPADVTLNHPMRFDHATEVISAQPQTTGDSEIDLVVEVKPAELDRLLDAIAKP